MPPPLHRTVYSHCMGLGMGQRTAPGSNIRWWKFHQAARWCLRPKFLHPHHLSCIHFWAKPSFVGPYHLPKSWGRKPKVPTKVTLTNHKWVLIYHAFMFTLARDRDQNQLFDIVPVLVHVPPQSQSHAVWISHYTAESPLLVHILHI